MNIKFKNIYGKDKEISLINQINEEAFPLEERVPISTIIAFADKGKGKLLGAYDQDEFIGFVLIIIKNNVGYLFLLAVEKSKRNQGYGSLILQEIFKKYENIQINLDFEILDPLAPNYEIRLRRKAFYLRNGLKETGHYTTLDNGYKFEIVTNKLPFNQEGLLEVLKILHTEVDNYPAKIL